MFKEYKNFDATGLAELLNKKEISPSELLDEAIFQTEILDPLINAIPQKHFELAKQQLESKLGKPFSWSSFLTERLTCLIKRNYNFGRF